MEDEVVVENDAPVVEEETVEVDAETESIENEAGEQQESEPSESSPEKPNKTQDRIDKLTRNRREAERDRDYWRDQALRNQQDNPAQKKPKPEALKKLEDFDYDEEKYQEYLFDAAQQNAVDEAKRALKEEIDQRSARDRMASFRDKEKSFSRNAADYAEIAGNPDLPVNDSMAETIRDMDNGPEVLYHLGKNIDIADSISRLSPLAAARELGRIEERLSSQIKSKTVSDAPKPAPKIKTANPAITKNVDDMTDKEFAAYRRKIIAKRGG